MNKAMRIFLALFLIEMGPLGVGTALAQQPDPTEFHITVELGGKAPASGEVGCTYTTASGRSFWTHDFTAMKRRAALEAWRRPG